MHRRGFIFALLLTAVFLLTAGYFFLTGSFFLTRIVLPWISNAAGTEITVSHAALRLFSGRIILHDYRMGDREQPFLTVRRARGTLQFLPLLRGRLEFSDVELTQARLRIVRNAAGAWCRQELGEAFFQDDEGSASDENTSFRLGLQQVSAEDSTIEIVLADRQNFRICFSEFNGIAENYRNGGTMVLKCAAQVQVGGRPGIDITSAAEWNGELDWADDFSLTGARGILNLPQLNGELDGTRLSGAGLQCLLHARRPRNGLWEFQRMQLVRQNLSGVTDLVELSGYCRENPLQYSLDLQRGEISGTFFSLLSELGRGLRPGDMQINASGRISGDPEQFRSSLKGTISRQAGPAYFGTEKVMLPDFQLTIAHDLGFNWQTCRSTVKQLDTQLHSGGKLRFQTAILPDQTVQYKIRDLDVRLLRLLRQDICGTFPVGGSLSGQGNLQIAHGNHADTLSGRIDLCWKNAGMQNAGWKNLPFDAALSAKLQLPLSSGLLKIAPLQFSVNDGKALQFNASGSIPLHRDHASVNWQLTADPDRLLPLVNQASAAAVMPFLQPFSPLKLTGSGKIDMAPDELRLKKHSLLLTGKDHTQLTLSMAEHRHSLIPGNSAPWQWNFSAAIPPRLLPRMTSGTMLTGGKTLLQGKIDGSADFADWNLTGELSWQELSGQLFGHPFADAGGGTEFSMHVDRNGDFTLNRAVAACRFRGDPVLRLENYGNGNIVTGEFSNTVQIRYAKETMLNLLLPWNLKTGQCSGNGLFSGNWKTGQYHLQSYAVLRQLQTPEMTGPVNGEVNCEYRRDQNAGSIPRCRLFLEQEKGAPVADLRLTMQSASDAGEPVRFRLSAEELDLARLNALFGGSADEASGQNEAHAAFDFGPHPLHWDLLLNKLYWNPEDLMTLSGSIRMQRNRIRIPQLLLTSGGGKLALQADGMDFPTGMMLNISLKLLSPMQIRPISTLCWPESQLTGILQEGAMKLQFRRLYTAKWQEDLVGRCRLKFKDLELPSENASGPLSRTLLLPLETMIRAEAIIPKDKDIRKHFLQLWAKNFDSQSPFARLKFSDGELRLQADGGRINVQKMEFTGEPVNNVTVTGYSIPDDPGELHLDFDASLCGVRARIPLRGTFMEPRIDGWQIFESNLKAWSDMLGFSSISDTPVQLPIFSPMVRMLRDLPKINFGRKP